MVVVVEGSQVVEAAGRNHDVGIVLEVQPAKSSTSTTRPTLWARLAVSTTRASQSVTPPWWCCCCTRHSCAPTH